MNKILIVGDASGVSGVIRQSLCDRGVQVETVVFSDPQSRCSSRAFVSVDSSMLMKLLGQLRFFIHLYFSLPKYEQVLVVGNVYMVGFLAIVKPKFLREFLLVRARNNGVRLIYYALGCDAFFAARDSEFCKGCKDLPDYQTNKCVRFYQNKASRDGGAINQFYSRVIVALPDYESVAGSVDLDIVEVKRVPLPFRGTTSFGAPKKISHKKLKVVHAPSGRNRKGSDYIERAVRDVLRRNPEAFDYTVLEGLPYKEYLSRLEEADVLIDQCLSESYGMSALAGIAAGKLVLSRSKTVDGLASPFIVDIGLMGNRLESVLESLSEIHFEYEAARAVEWLSEYHSPEKCVTEIFYS